MRHKRRLMRIPLRAVSPQMPVTDWYMGDDFHHNGALFLADTFLFYANFGKPRPKPSPKARWDFDLKAATCTTTS